MLASVRLGKINTCSPMALHLKSVCWMLVFSKDVFRCERWRTCVRVSCMSAERVASASLTCPNRDPKFYGAQHENPWATLGCQLGYGGRKLLVQGLGMQGVKFFSWAVRQSLALRESVCSTSGPKWKCLHVLC